MKKLGKPIAVILILGFILTIIIYNNFKTDNKEYLVIGDSISLGKTPYEILGYSFSDYFYEDNNNLSTSNNNILIENITSRDVYEFLEENSKVGNNEVTIKQAISSSNILVVSLGMDEINNNQNINIYLYYMDKILSNIRKFYNEEIYIISLYGDESKIVDINNNLYDLTVKYNAYYVDISVINDINYLYNDTYYANIYGQKRIASELNKIYKLNNIK